MFLEMEKEWPHKLKNLMTTSLFFFKEEKNGSYYRNFCGIIEHFYYHLGQIVVIKKILAAQNANKVY